jgi:exosome complex exonuclease RRP6
MRNELVRQSNLDTNDDNKMQRVLNDSKETALKRYENPIYDNSGAFSYMTLLRNKSAKLSNEQFSVLRAVHRWRDSVARKEDESVVYVMDNHAVLSIAREMPTSKADLFKAVKRVSSLIRMQADELVNVIVKAKEEGLSGPSFEEAFRDLRVKPLSEPSARLQASTNHGSTNTAPKSVVAESPVQRMGLSQFWGNIPLLRGQRRYNSTIRLSIPLPPLMPDLPTLPPTISGPTLSQKETATHDTVPEAQEEEAFVLRELGNLRKRKVEETAGAAVNELETVTPDAIGANVKAKEKAEKKAAKKAAKRLKQQQQEQQEKEEKKSPSISIDDGQADPFDYQNAPSVLHATPQNPHLARKNSKAKGKAVPFDPFKKGMDAPQGLGRKQKEIPGRSHTYSK